MRVLVIGGTGLIGRALSSSLVADGHTAIVSTRNPDRVKGMPGGVQLVKWDAATTDGWAQSLDGADAVVNMVGENLAEGRWSGERKQRILDSRLSAGRLLMQAVEAASVKPKVLVQSSAVDYYGPHGDEVVTEDSPPGASFLANVCFQWEASTAAVEKLGVRRPVIRTGIVLSLDGGALPKILLPLRLSLRLFAGGKVGSGKQYWPWIHIQDEVRAIRFLIDADSASGPFNLTAPEPVTAGDFAKAVGKVTRRPSFPPAPGFALKLALGEMSSVLLDKQRAVPSRLEELGFTFSYPTLDSALRDLLA